MTEDAFGIVGTQVAGCYIDRVVAEGKFAVVYRAQDGLGSALALKLLRISPLNLAQRSEFTQLFRAQAELLVQLAASLVSIVRPLRADVLTTSSGHFAPYWLLEWLDGISLAALIEQRRDSGQAPISLRKLVRLLTPVARALDRAHHSSAQGSCAAMVHGGVRPENLFITQLGGEELVKISGFGSHTIERATAEA